MSELLRREGESVEDCLSRLEESAPDMVSDHLREVVARFIERTCEQRKAAHQDSEDE